MRRSPVDSVIAPASDLPTWSNDMVTIDGNERHPVLDGQNTRRLLTVAGATLGPAEPIALDATSFPAVLTPQTGSPAIDHDGNTGLCAPEDERGASRPLDGDGDGIARCDVGPREIRPNAVFFDGFEPLAP